MQIEFDNAKDAANRQRHGISLAYAARLNRDFAMVSVDDRFEYEEVRMRALVPAGSILYYVAFVDRADVYRIISLRRATRNEVRSYVENC